MEKVNDKRKRTRGVTHERPGKHGKRRALPTNQRSGREQGQATNPKTSKGNENGESTVEHEASRPSLGLSVNSSVLDRVFSNVDPDMNRVFKGESPSDDKGGDDALLI